MTSTTTAPKDNNNNNNPPTLQLHTYFRSSCSARLRLALALKHLPHTPHFIHLLHNDQKAPAYTALNPSGTVPTLTHTLPSGQTITIPQSIPALEYLEEAFPDATPHLLPTDPVARATVRSLVAMIASDTQPVTNSCVSAAVADMGLDGPAWNKRWTTRGLDAFEAALERVQTDPRFCVGESVSMADVCLIPAVWNAERWECDLGRWPRVGAVVRGMEGWEAVRVAHWRRQEDTPGEFREE